MGLCVLFSFLALMSVDLNNVPLEQQNDSKNPLVEQNISVSSVYSKKLYSKIWNKYGLTDKKEIDYMYMVCNNSKNVNNCLRMSISIPFHETKMGREWVGKYNNLYGMMMYVHENWVRKQVPMVFINRMASFEDWITRYNEFWYPNDCNEMITRSRYTTTQTVEWIQSCNQVASEFYSLSR